MSIQRKRNVCISKLLDKTKAQLVYIAIKLPGLVALPLSYSSVNNHNVSLIRLFRSYGTSIVAMSYTRFVPLLETAMLVNINTFIHYRCSQAANIFAGLYIICNKPYPYLTLRSLTLYIYGAPILDVSRSHTTTQHSR